MHRGGFDAGHKAKVEHKEAALGLAREQSFHLLIEAVGGTEQQIALQAHALDLPPVLGENGKLIGATIERRAIFGAVEAELDRVHPARADGEGGAADDHADQHAGDEADLQNQEGDGKKRDILDRRDPPRRVDQPLVDELAAEISRSAPSTDLGT